MKILSPTAGRKCISRLSTLPNSLFYKLIMKTFITAQPQNPLNSLIKIRLHKFIRTQDEWITNRRAHRVVGRVHPAVGDDACVHPFRKKCAHRSGPRSTPGAGPESDHPSKALTCRFARRRATRRSDFVTYSLDRAGVMWIRTFLTRASAENYAGVSLNFCGRSCKWINRKINGTRGASAGCWYLFVCVCSIAIWHTAAVSSLH